jgi:hypothetical protein
LKRKFEIVLLAEMPRVELKSGANESWRLPGSNAPSFIAIQAKNGRVMVKRRSKEGSKKDQRTAR